VSESACARPSSTPHGVPLTRESRGVCVRVGVSRVGAGTSLLRYRRMSGRVQARARACSVDTRLQSASGETSPGERMAQRATHDTLSCDNSTCVSCQRLPPHDSHTHTATQGNTQLTMLLRRTTGVLPIVSRIELYRVAAARVVCRARAPAAARKAREILTVAMVVCGVGGTRNHSGPLWGQSVFRIVGTVSFA
jgi:hypothetical protein